MTRYETLKDKPKRFVSLTGNHTLEEFSALLPSFSKRFLEFVETQTLDGKRRKKRRYTLYKNSCLPTQEDMLLFIFRTYAFPQVPLIRGFRRFKSQKSILLY